MISTHILNIQTGKPAQGIKVRLLHTKTQACLGEEITDSNGRIADFQIATPIEEGVYTLEYYVSPYFQLENIVSFFPKIDITFTIHLLNEHYHVPLLLSAHAYSTYRGS